MIGATTAFAGMIAAGVFLGRFLDRRNGLDALASIFGFVLMGVALIGIFT